MWLSKGASGVGAIVQTGYITFRFHKRYGIYRHPDRILLSNEGLYSLKLITK
jgi:hypothetical protein